MAYAQRLRGVPHGRGPLPRQYNSMLRCRLREEARAGHPCSALDPSVISLSSSLWSVCVCMEWEEIEQGSGRPFHGGFLASSMEIASSLDYCLRISALGLSTVVPECSSPFDYCDIVTSTTHKNLSGPRGGIIFFRKGRILRKRSGSFSQGDENDYDFEDKINFAVFPSLQGGPHNNHIASLAITPKQVATPEYKAYIQQVKKNA